LITPKKQTTEVYKTLREEAKNAGQNAGPVESEHSESIYPSHATVLIPDRASLKGGPEGRRPSVEGPSLFGQVKEMFQEAYNGHPSAVSSHPTGVAGAGKFSIESA